MLGGITNSSAVLSSCMIVLPEQHFNTPNQIKQTVYQLEHSTSNYESFCKSIQMIKIIYAVSHYFFYYSIRINFKVSMQISQIDKLP